MVFLKPKKKQSKEEMLLKASCKMRTKNAIEFGRKEVSVSSNEQFP